MLSYLFASKYRIETGFEDSGDVPYHNLFVQGFDALYENATNDDCNPALYLKGIKFIDEVNMSKPSRGKGIYYKNEYSIYPQYCIEMENSNYRIDFAIICQLYEDRLLKNEIKIAIECDGFEFHSSKEDLKRDTSRNRIFTRNGWKPYRFSGSEIYNMTINKDIERLFYEIRSLANGII